MLRAAFFEGVEGLIVAHDPLRAADQSGRRRALIAELEAQAEKMVAKLDAQDGGKTARGRRASDRGAYSRFTRAVAEAELTRLLKADLQADRFSYSIDEDLLQFLDDRVGIGSTIFVGQRPYSDWHDFIDDLLIADAILDRLSSNRHHIKLKGHSQRRSEASFAESGK